MQSESGALFISGRHYGIDPTSSSGKTPPKKPIPGTADFFPIARRQVLIIFLFDLISPVCEDLDYGGSHVVSRGRQGDVYDIGVMRNRGAGACCTYEERKNSQEAEAA